MSDVSVKTFQFKGEHVSKFYYLIVKEKSGAGESTHFLVSVSPQTHSWCCTRLYKLIELKKEILKEEFKSSYFISFTAQWLVSYKHLKITVCSFF